MTGRPRAFDREAALERAMLAFWKHGYEATSVAMLTEAMGINAPSMYGAYGDKRALFGEALERYMITYGAFMISTVRDEPDPRTAITRLLLQAAAMFTSSEHPPGCLMISAATNCSPQSLEVESRLRGLRAYAIAAMEDKILRGRRGAAARAESHTLALFFEGTLQGMSALARDGASKDELESVARTALRAWPE
ncbi:MAG: TetR/AcrR family transcriptional regulator [Deltaproteobacteria bacterium]